MKKLLAVILSILFVLTMAVSCVTSSYLSKNNNKTENELDITLHTEAIKVLTAEDVLAKTIDVSKNVDNFGMNAEMELSMSAMGETVDMVMNMDCEKNNKAVYLGMDMKMTGIDEATKLDTYIDLTADPMVQYVDVGEFWIKQKVDATTATQYAQGNMQMDLSMYSEYMKNATMNEVDFNDTKCYEVSGIIDIDYMEFIKNMNLESMIGDLEEMGLPENFYEEVFKETEPFMLVMGVNAETFLPEYASIDMTQMMDALMSKVMEIINEQYGEEETGNVDISFSKCNMNCVYRDYNSISLEIPAEIIENSVEY